MPSRLKVILPIVGVTGLGGGAVPLVLWQTGKLGVSGTKDLSSDSASQAQNSLVPALSETKDTEQGNCEVIEIKEEDIFTVLKVDKDEYTAIYCKNTNSKDSKVTISNQWTGLFPNELFISSFSHQKGEHLNIKTQTTNEDEDNEEFRTIFTGNKFIKSSITGTWGGAKQVIKDKTVTTVKVTESEDLFDFDSIYLWFSGNNRR